MKINTSLFVFIFSLIISYAKAQEQGVIINEFSNGPSGTKEYIEFLVVGCPGSRVDIRGWKFDDNNGDFSGGPVTGKGIARGHSRFSMDAQWASVPVGALILVYNKDDKNASITLSDDPSDSNIDSVYVLSHDHSQFIETCNDLPNTGVGNDQYTSCTVYGSGVWATVGMRNDGDATQVRRPDGTYFHGFGWGDNDGGPDNLYFSGGGTNRVYSYTSSSCNYRNISNFSAQVTRDPVTNQNFETPGYPNNSSNLNYIRFLREGITPGTISGDQTICSGAIPADLTESGSFIRCYVTYQWQSSTTNVPANFSNITGATDYNYTPPALTTTTYFRRIVSNLCEQDTSNIVTVTIDPLTGRADQPSVNSTELCINPPNSIFSIPAVVNAIGYTWEVFPAQAGTLTNNGLSAEIDWNDSYSGVAKIVAKALGCGGNIPSDTTYITISLTQANAGADELNICGTSVTLSAGAGAGTWSILSGTGGNFDNNSLYNSSFTGVAGETYTLRWTVSSSICTAGGEDDVQISFSNTLPSPSVNDLSGCLPGNYTLTATGGSNGEYRWYLNGSLMPIPNEFNDSYQTATISGEATYYVSLHNGHCESSKVPVKVTISPNAQAEAGTDQTIIKGNYTTLKGSGNGTFQWSPSQSLSDPAVADPVATPRETTTYLLTVKTPDGCTAQDTVTIYVVCDQITIPNLITPNGDDKNDTFVIGCTEDLNWNLQITNRWGETVYQNINYQNEWNAEGLSNGVYYFFLTSDVLNVSYKGWVEVRN